ncbi:hypothetical protein G3A_03560 [Bacillus sp. 17376]|nr:hypothetical protein G3A_03560 [Bacillus sp. 17376]
MPNALKQKKKFNKLIVFLFCEISKVHSVGRLQPSFIGIQGGLNF